MQLYKKMFTLCALFLLFRPVPSAAIPFGRFTPHTYGSQQLIPAGHWIYDALAKISAEAAVVDASVSAPLSAAEIGLYLNALPEERLSPAGQKLYERVIEYLYGKKASSFFGIGGELILNPALTAKTSPDIDWTFATDYTGHITSNGIAGVASNNSGYGAASSFNSSFASNPFAALPLYITFGKNIVIETVPMFGKSFWGMADNSNFTNFVYKADDMEFLWPKTANISAGKAFDTWGINVNLSRQGLERGRTLTGSIIYNSTFETDFYAQLNLYAAPAASRFRYKYALDAVEINKNRYICLHTFELEGFRRLKIGITEGILLEQPFELRFLNPLMVIHSFGAWRDYMTADEEKYYGEAHTAAYMGIQAEWAPVKYLRAYFLYAQNEIQTEAEKQSLSGKLLPDSFGVQLGAELNIPDKTGGWWQTMFEGVYTSPFLYIKQGADWSFYSRRYDMQNNGSVPIYSWIGSPFGPDCIGAAAKLEYSVPFKWSAALTYLFAAHGTNSFGIFNNTVTIGGKTYYAYYPSVLHKLGLANDDKLLDMARTLSLTGVIQYTNRISIKGSYSITESLTAQAQADYSFIFNNKNEAGRFNHGLQCSLILQYHINTF